MDAAIGRIQRRGPAAEQGRLVTPPRRLLDKLRPLDLAEPKPGIRACDVAAFTKVAQLTGTAILLRATNPKSLRFIGGRRYVAKPGDCKAKTAQADDIVDGQIVECGGLVADPTRLSGKAFSENAQEHWQKFVRDQRRRVSAKGFAVYERRSGKGFFAVDTAPPDTLRRHHGCLMVTEHEMPKDFDPALSHTRKWMDQHMAYIHGDYDLYGVVEVGAATSRPQVRQETVQQERLLGQVNFFTSRTQDVIGLLNAEIGHDLLQHGEQAAMAFSAGKLYLFMPDGKAHVMAEGPSKPEMQGMLADFFRYVLRTELVR